jgi:alkylhydroperoxidase family enzyme
MILRTAQLTGSKYEWSIIAPMAEEAGVASGQIEDLRRWQTSDAYGDLRAGGASPHRRDRQHERLGRDVL